MLVLADCSKNSSPLSADAGVLYQQLAAIATHSTLCIKAVRHNCTDLAEAGQKQQHATHISERRATATAPRLPVIGKIKPVSNFRVGVVKLIGWSGQAKEQKRTQAHKNVPMRKQEST